MWSGASANHIMFAGGPGVFIYRAAGLAPRPWTSPQAEAVFDLDAKIATELGGADLWSEGVAGEALLRWRATTTSHQQAAMSTPELESEMRAWRERACDPGMRMLAMEVVGPVPVVEGRASWQVTVPTALLVVGGTRARSSNTRVLVAMFRGQGVVSMCQADVGGLGAAVGVDVGGEGLVNTSGSSAELILAARTGTHAILGLCVARAGAPHHTKNETYSRTPAATKKSMEKLGAYVMQAAETSPVNWKGQTLIVETVSGNTPGVFPCCTCTTFGCVSNATAHTGYR